jgi:catechol 2,3-dioxygenase-like lactoylglutathione lyase family enzyme
VQLVVRDVGASAAWYCRVLGLEQFVSGEMATGPYVGLRHPQARFVIGLQSATEEERVHLGAPMIEHLSFSVADRSALEARQRALRTQGFEVGEIFEEAVSYNVRLRDPDGLSLELTAPKPAQFQAGSSG